ncbi:hypothetical protein KNO15_01105 [Leifsonia shinshuensis]|uniref:DUF7507 domain-containing protein n=1 Tax=Leifsonia shinshuensis TaxID=150026 RepID=UPI001F50AA5B|nr:hypothetical protein [Leifsonia shinshuensis]MCI0155299.1 hypothetical protein [Leifsonia shinshuensis]
MSTHATSPRRALRPGPVLAATSALLLSLVATAWPTATPPAHAAGALICSGTAIYGEVPGDPAVPSVSDVLAIDGTSVGGAQLGATLETTGTILGLNQNALGITADGSAAYSASDRGATIMRYDAVSGTWSGYPGESSGANVTAGAVDPVTGIYYFGDLSTAGGTTGHIWGFDTRTNQLISDDPVITFSVPAGQSNGDFAFDGSGNLYVVSSSATDGTLMVLQAPLPQTAAQAAALVATELSTFAVPGGAAVNGIAFDGTGTLYLSQGGTNGVFSIDPGTGTLRGALTPLASAQAGPTGRGLVDLASCAFPPTVSVQKNVVSRVNPTDQFTLTATGATISLPATATTTGTATGLQTTAGGHVLQAGPALARFDDDYTVTETAAGTTDLSRYLTTYSCIDSANPTNPEFPITGSGTTATFTLDAFAGESPSVVCTFTNEARAASLGLTKSASPTTYTQAGDTVDYTYTVTNDGNTPVSAIDIAETGFTGSGTPPVPVCSATALDPGATTQCAASYAVTAADVAAGSVSNTAVAQGRDAVLGAVTSPAATAVVSVDPVPALSLTKSVDHGTVSGAGESVTYSYLIANTGNVPVTGIGVTESSFSGSGATPVVSCPASAASLAPGATVTCTAPYQLTQADADSGHVDNTAVAAGSDPAGANVTSAASTATVTIPATPSLTLDKKASPTTVTARDQSIGYSFLVANTGNVTLSDVSITEQSFSGTGGPLAVVCPSANSIAPGASMTCTADYRVTDADIASGRITNRATADATDPSGASFHSEESEATVEVDIPVVPLPPAAESARVTLPDTGGTVLPWLAPLAALLGLAGTGIAVMTARRRSRTHEE